MTPDIRYMHDAYKVARESHDPDRKVGAVIVSPFNRVVSKAANRLPDDVLVLPQRCEKPQKFMWIEHAERRAIQLAAKNGHATNGCRMYSTRYPCAECARAIINAGLFEVITNPPDFDHPRWGESYAVAREMFAETGVLVRFAGDLVIGGVG